MTPPPNFEHLEQMSRDLSARAAQAARKAGNAPLLAAAIVREPLPHFPGAELWMTYTAAREEALAILRDEHLRAMLPHTIRTLDPDALNGYVAYPRAAMPRVPATTGGLVKWIPVHGGVTYARRDREWAVWGFDTVHCDSENFPRTDRDWIRAHCHVLHRGIVLCAELWPEWRRARGNHEARAALAQRVIDLEPEQRLIDRMGFEALLATLSGNL